MTSTKTVAHGLDLATDATVHRAEDTLLVKPFERWGTRLRRSYTDDIYFKSFQNLSRVTQGMTAVTAHPTAIELRAIMIVMATSTSGLILLQEVAL
jgi:hypothetical protein